MTPIQVIGMGLEGPRGLAANLQDLIAQATVLAGSDRLLHHFTNHPATRWGLEGLERRLATYVKQPDPGLVVVLTSGDPLFFGLGRQLLQALPPETLTFHPHVSSIQLAFSRLKLPWQEAVVVSGHGRSLLPLAAPVKAGANLIAVLTDRIHTPQAIARFLLDLDTPTPYRLWVCENLGGTDERIHPYSLAADQQETFADLNVVVLERLNLPPVPSALPVMGIPDSAFLSFCDRPGLMTKREIRVQILSELALRPQQVMWDIGAGTGSVSVEMARLVPDGEVWAIEQTTAGAELIRQNARRFNTPNLQVVQGNAPAVLASMPSPHRIFIGGSGGYLIPILEYCTERLLPDGRCVVALTTLEHQATLAHWLLQHPTWAAQWLQIALARSIAIASLTRWTPLNPITLVCLQHSLEGGTAG